MKFILSTIFVVLWVAAIEAGTSMNGIGLSINVDKKLPKVNAKNKRGTAYPLEGGFNIAEFYCNITLGTPAQTLYVQVDTGSSDLLVFGNDCSSCTFANGDYPYDPATSSTSKSVGCQTNGYYCETCNNQMCGFLDTYGDNSQASGSVYVDVFGVGAYSGVAVSFGVIDDVSGNFENPPVDGIWGISYPDLAFTTPAIDYLITQENLANTFSMCTSVSKPVMSIGIDYSANPNFQWTDIVAEEYYNVQITDMLVGGKSLNLSSAYYNSPMAIVDSGTTLILLEDSTFNVLMNIFTNMCPGLTGYCGEGDQSIFNGYCYGLNQNDINAYPDVAIAFNGITTPFTLTPSQYLFPSQNGNQVLYCGGFGSSGSEGTILGDVFMQGYHVAFDRTHSKVGFAPLATCPTAGTTSSSGKTSSLSTGQHSTQSTATIFQINFVLVAFSLIMSILL